ncbi:MAG: polysaccharide pyruvyl transferase family protein [Candidatus Paceibacterota bacterium]
MIISKLAQELSLTMKRPFFIPKKLVIPIKKIQLILKSKKYKFEISKKYLLLENKRKIIYALVPPSELTNIGDHAQVIAIRLWFERHYPEYPVLEVDKNEVIYGQELLKNIISRDDVIFLHSGGNLGDRGMWSETGRRLMIQNFPDNKIISLPQTIYFSDTEKGNEQKEITRKIYAEHRRLTIIGRDKESGELAKKLFPNSQVLTIPDFVLSMRIEDFNLERKAAPTDNVIACLRRDDESKFNEKEIREIIGFCGKNTTIVDTTLESNIDIDFRINVVRQFLENVINHKAMVTDRFHGAIFSVICGRPAVVLPTVDHKLTSAVEWFGDMSSVIFCPEISELDNLLNKLLNQNISETIDFREKYFDKLPEYLNI